MFLKDISIIDYKNIRSSDLQFVERINCFVGANGAGKTNFLDSVYYLSLCKSLTGTTDRQNLRHEAKFFIVEGHYYTTETHDTYLCNYSPPTKTIKRNGKNYTKISEHIGALPLVSVTPSDAMLVYESGEVRRKYLDTFISQISSDYLSSLIRYNSVITQRNILLKSEISQDKLELIEVYDMQLSVLAHTIYDARKKIVEQLSPIVTEYYNQLSGGKEVVELDYASMLERKPMEELLRQSFVRDCACGHTTAGVGRDDLRMKIDGYPLKRFGSQGQQKSFVIAMKLAQYDIMVKMKNSKPILLLDDIFDRLDSDRVRALLKVVSDDKFGQIFITDCDSDRIFRILENQSSEYRIFEIINGEAQWRRNIL